MTTFTFIGSTNSKFDEFSNKPCKLGTDGKHLILVFEDGRSITTSRISYCHIFDTDLTVGGGFCVFTNNSSYDFYCHDDDKLLKTVSRINQIADSNRLHANIIADVSSGFNIGEALAHAISDQVKGQKAVVC